jgi:hypothetical protein
MKKLSILRNLKNGSSIDHTITRSCIQHFYDKEQGELQCGCYLKVHNLESI